jgi:hypothetical protein
LSRVYMKIIIKNIIVHLSSFYEVVQDHCAQYESDLIVRYTSQLT